MKICKYCAVNKNDDCFAIKRRKKPNGEIVERLHWICKECDPKYQKEIYDKLRQDKDYVEKQNKYSREYRYKNGINKPPKDPKRTHQECIKCKIDYNIDFYSKKIDGRGYSCISGTCLKCCRERDKIYYAKYYLKESYREKAIKNAKHQHIKNRTKLTDGYVLRCMKQYMDIEKASYTDVEFKKIEILMRRINTKIKTIKNEKQN